MVLDVLQLAGEPRQLPALRLVLHGDERLEARLVVEELVFVDFVGPMVGSIAPLNSIQATSLS